MVMIYPKEIYQYVFYFVAFIFIFLGVFLSITSGYFNPRLELIPLNIEGNNIIFLGILTALIFIAIAESINYLYSRAIEKNIPRFLDTIIENIKGGITYTKAILDASEIYKYPLGRIMKDAMIKFSMGMNFDDCMKYASKKLNHPKANELISVLSKGYYAGENSVTVLKTASNYYWMIEEYKATRENDLKTYISVIFIAIIIYLVISTIVAVQLIKPLTEVQVISPEKTIEGTLPQTGGIERIFGTVNFDTIKVLFYWIGFLESLFAGIIIGKLVYNHSGFGLIYSIILIIITISFYNGVLLLYA